MAQEDLDKFFVSFLAGKPELRECFPRAIGEKCAARPNQEFDIDPLASSPMKTKTTK
jgi:hypothetical protein